MPDSANPWKTAGYFEPAQQSLHLRKQEGHSGKLAPDRRPAVIAQNGAISSERRSAGATTCRASARSRLSTRIAVLDILERVTVMTSVAPSMATWPKNCRP
jgi:hypothetical protein